MSYIFNPFVAQRRQHKLELAEFIKKNPYMERERVIALFSLRTGLKRETIKKYLEELEEAGVLEFLKEEEKKEKKENGGHSDNNASTEGNSERTEQANK
jgi:hypothetical protein